VSPPDWALTLSFWLHMLATVVWIGGLAVLSLVVIPAGRQALSPAHYSVLLAGIQRRLDPLAWFSLAILVVTGLVQMTGNPNYNGFLAIDNRWALAILAKHVAFVGMTVVSAALTWWVLPGLRRAALRQSHGQPVPPSEQLQGRELRLLRLNLALSLVVLALTALARTA
jgi:uncharacterized membrane protein